jgi:hypothetical protein
VRSDCWLSALTLALALGAVHTPRVYAADPLRLVVRIASSADRALLPRLHGQLSDVDAQLIVIETSPLEAALTAQLATARTLASQHAADAVVWCVRLRS